MKPTNQSPAQSPAQSRAQLMTMKQPAEHRSLYWLSAIAFLIAMVFTVPGHAQESGIESLKETSKAFASVTKRVSPAVVFIQVEKTVARGRGNPFGGQDPSEFFRRFFGPDFPGFQHPGQPGQPAPERKSQGQGSGFIISQDGYILTNNHVVGDADKITVKMQNGNEYTAKIVGTDKHSDVAVIKIDQKNLPMLQLGDSDALEVGEWVLAIGNPFGLSHTLTTGVVSAKGRSNVGLADYENFIQTDAAINPGNSGGPLIDLDGRVVGINTAIFSRSGGYMGIGFAIPINMVKNIKDQLISTGNVTRGFLGIVIQDMTPALAESFNLDNNHKGILVAEVSDDSPADKAGFKQGDVIVELEGRVVKNVGSFRNRIAMQTPGAKQNITVMRDGKRKTLAVTIGTLPDAGVASTGGIDGSNNNDKLGLTVQSITDELAAQLDLEDKDGVVITEVKPGSPAAEAGLKPGLLIKEVNRQPVKSLSDFKKATAKSKDKGSILLLVKNGGFSSFIVIKTDG